MEIYTQASGWSSVTYGVMRVTETGWDSEAVQSWMVKYTGNYRNNLVWAGDYKMDFSYLNVYNQSDVTFTLSCVQWKLPRKILRHFSDCVRPMNFVENFELCKI